MKAVVNGIVVEGTPQEMQEFTSAPLPVTIKQIPVKTESDILREKLAKDPNYNPYGGVVSSKEMLQNLSEQEDKRRYGADLDTGIEDAL